MPLFDFLCLDCSELSEILVTGDGTPPVCAKCGSTNLKKMLSAHSSLSGPRSGRMPGAGDTACCGSAPGDAAGCAGPGSCCGRR
jgi:putative FmdB family regulatory protein